MNISSGRVHPPTGLKLGREGAAANLCRTIDCSRKSIRGPDNFQKSVMILSASVLNLKKKHLSPTQTFLTNSRRKNKLSSDVRWSGQYSSYLMLLLMAKWLFSCWIQSYNIRHRGMRIDADCSGQIQNQQAAVATARRTSTANYNGHTGTHLTGYYNPISTNFLHSPALFEPSHAHFSLYSVGKNEYTPTYA